jgi:hypothetical protein
MDPDDPNCTTADPDAPECQTTDPSSPFCFTMDPDWQACLTTDPDNPGCTTINPYDPACVTMLPDCPTADPNGPTCQTMDPDNQNCQTTAPEDPACTTDPNLCATTDPQLCPTANPDDEGCATMIYDIPACQTTDPNLCPTANPDDEGCATMIFDSPACQTMDPDDDACWPTIDENDPDCGNVETEDANCDTQDPNDGDCALEPTIEPVCPPNPNLLDLDIADVSEDLENTRGGFMGLNDDDDNGNGNPDREDNSAVSGENDLIPIHIHYDRNQVNNGRLRLRAVVGGGNIKCWSTPNRAGNTKVVLDKEWNLPAEAPPETLYLEGYSATPRPRGVTLLLEYLGEPALQDTVKATVCSASPRAPKEEQYFYVGPGECDIWVKVLYGGYDETDPGHKIWWDIWVGNNKLPGKGYDGARRLGEGWWCWLKTWDTDQSPPADVWIESNIQVDGKILHKKKVGPIHMLAFTWGMNGRIGTYAWGTPTRYNDFHYGIDILGPKRTPVVAADRGTAGAYKFDYINPSQGIGGSGCVLIRHVPEGRRLNIRHTGNGSYTDRVGPVYTDYHHMITGEDDPRTREDETGPDSRVGIDEDVWVNQLARIGLCGETGLHCWGSHVHFAVEDGGPAWRAYGNRAFGVNPDVNTRSSTGRATPGRCPAHEIHPGWRHRNE